ncbi:3-keto-5-aminohexanoate cleavage protein [Nonomuraea soli]|uniref:Uncharacterized protein (DUF849 family) n=1 Tax=Nonomuraea soli TaxID=1032476 RepID=A0A7W0HUV6_9ACTN|nr:3-keto-5-aminohexanoate cleavage protein [Nonomuraea soli]MBA2896500.1 uncharacterized protein (DUF849 family) [Nonomuraea soli]
MLQVCLNGARGRAEHERLPLTPAELAAAAKEAVAAGAEDIHLHPKDDGGADTMEPDHVAAAVTAVRSAVPGIPVGVTTGAWTGADRAGHVRAWSVLPDHASVNWHEDGAAELADTLLERGVGIEAGIFSGTGAAERFLAWPRAGRVLRVLAEITDTDPVTAVGSAVALVEELAGRPILLHGEDDAAWAVLAVAGARGLSTRIGLEDTLRMPDGSPAPDNAALVAAARRLLARRVRRS